MSVPAFKVEKISPRLTRIYALSSELMYLVEGDERAALLDTGSGIGFVRPLVEQLTDKPVVVLVTHGHVDHAMGASEFSPESVYMSLEDAYIYTPHSTHAFRETCLFEMGPAADAVVPEEDFTPVMPVTAFNDLREGDRFDLGGVSVEVYACPGHTKGSMVMLIPEERMLLLGDACNSNTFLFQDYSLTVEEYRESLLHLMSLVDGRFDTILSSHGDGLLDIRVMEENLVLCDRLLEGTADQVPMEFMGDKGFHASRTAAPRHGNIVYHPDRIRRPV